MEGYNNTEIGFFPNDWNVGRIDAFFKIQQGKQVSKSNRVGKNQRPFLRTSNIYWGKIVLEELDYMHFSNDEEAKYRLKKNDLLVCDLNSFDFPPYNLKSTAVVSFSKSLNPIISSVFSEIPVKFRCHILSWCPSLIFTRSTRSRSCRNASASFQTSLRSDKLSRRHCR